jgi:hypothetical protein
MIELPQDAYISHLCPGRVRIKIPSQKKNGPFFSSIKGLINSVPGMERVEINPDTGSVLIAHNLDPESVSHFLKKHRLLKDPIGGPAKDVHQEITRFYQSADSRVKGFLGGVNLGTLAFLVLIGAGTYQILRGNFTAIPWYSAFWYGLSIFLKSKPDGIPPVDGE